MIRPVFLLLCSAFLALTVVGDEVDLLKIAVAHKGPGNGKWTLGDTLHPFRNGYQWRTPPGAQTSKVDLEPIKVKGGTSYILDCKMLPTQALKIHVYATFYDHDGNAGPRLHVMSFQNSSIYWKIERELIVPPGVEQLELCLVLSDMKLTENTNLGFISEMKLRSDGPLKPHPELAGLYGKNLLPLGDFSGFAEGESNLEKLHIMRFSQKPFTAEVTGSEADRALKIHYRPGDYQYVTWFTPELPLYGSAGVFKCRLRGKGRVQLMIWWNRPDFPTVFKHFGYFDLTPEYRDYEIAVGCDDPLTRKAAVAVSCRDQEAVFEIASLSFIVPEIKPSNKE